jgi:hypothetical protein
MTRARQKELFDKLISGYPQDVPMTEEFCYEDINRIQPVIDDIENQAYLRGQFQMLLWLADHCLRRRIFLTPF